MTPQVRFYFGNVLDKKDLKFIIFFTIKEGLIKNEHNYN